MLGDSFYVTYFVILSPTNPKNVTYRVNENVRKRERKVVRVLEEKMKRWPMDTLQLHAARSLFEAAFSEASF